MTRRYRAELRCVIVQDGQRVDRVAVPAIDASKSDGPESTDSVLYWVKGESLFAISTLSGACVL
jgi:hypothetical protein